MTIAVLAIGQTSTDQASEFLPKHIALRLVHRGWADQISKAKIRRRQFRRVTEIVIRSGYIPDKWPPVEIPNTRFREPQSDAWKLAHRSVI